MDKSDPKNTIGYMPMPDHFPYRSIFLKGRPQHEKYDDFRRMHPPMDPVYRAKIFAPFDALAGFGECIAGKEVEYSLRQDLGEGKKRSWTGNWPSLSALPVTAGKHGKTARWSPSGTFIPARI